MQMVTFHSFINFIIYGPSKIPAFAFSVLNCGNVFVMYLKNFPYLLRVFTYSLTSSNLICKAGNIIWSFEINSETFITFRLPETKVSLEGPS